jgi:hypothetical protein
MFPEPTQEQMEALQQKLLDLIRSNLTNEQIYHLYVFFDETPPSEVLHILYPIAKQAAPDNFSIPEKVTEQLEVVGG